MTLDLLEPGHSGIIATIGGEGALRRRLLDMGLTPNTKVTVRKVAPMGDPIELYLRGYVLTLRKDDAVKITLKEENQG
ncbi:MAG: ferrous iron transport protein A [Clostridiales bacterium]|nr:ferrous iron transport protein A [Clostridiales bacterium]